MKESFTGQFGCLSSFVYRPWTPCVPVCDFVLPGLFLANYYFLLHQIIFIGTEYSNNFLFNSANPSSGCIDRESTAQQQQTMRRWVVRDRLIWPICAAWSVETSRHVGVTAQEVHDSRVFAPRCRQCVCFCTACYGCGCPVHVTLVPSLGFTEGRPIGHS